jgi:hypothetical protein
MIRADARSWICTGESLFLRELALDRSEDHTSWLHILPQIVEPNIGCVDVAPIIDGDA